MWMKRLSVRGMCCISLVVCLQIAGHLYASERQSVQPIVTVPMEYDPPRIPVPLIQLSINGSRPAWFALISSLDAALVIDQSKAKEFKLDDTTGWVSLQSVHLVKESGVPANELDIPAAYLSRLNLNINRIANIEVAGLLGANFFAGLPVELNFREKKLSFYNNKIYEILEDKKDQYLPVKLYRLSLRSWVHAVRVAVPGNAQLQMEIATGVSNTVLSRDDLRTVELAEIAPNLTYAQVEGRGVVPRLMGRLAWLKVGSATIHGLVCELDLEGDYPTRLGCDTLSLFDSVVISYREGMMLIKRPKDDRVVARERGHAGLTLFRDRADKVRVWDLTPNSAAEKAGIAVGDEVLAINGRTLESESLDAITLMINGYAGVPVRVKISRAETVKELTLVPDSMFSELVPLVDPPVKGMTNLSLSLSRLDPGLKDKIGFRVVLVETRSAENSSERFLLVTQISSETIRQSGLRVGDQIVAINGQSVSRQAEAEIEALLRESDMLSLTVKRLTEKEVRQVIIQKQSPSS